MVRHRLPDHSKGKRKVQFSRMFTGPNMLYHEVPPPPEDKVIEPYPSMESLASFTRNVCFVEPKGDMAIVVGRERTVLSTLGMPTKASWQRYQAILKAAQKHCDELVHKEGKQTCDMDQVALFGTSIDATGDGKEDYVSEFAVTNPRGTQEGRVFALLSNNSGTKYHWLSNPSLNQGRIARSTCGSDDSSCGAVRCIRSSW